MEEGDIILCKVESVTNTITFVRLPNGKEGTIISSEISPGRIKYMRQFVVPNKKIVCKILEISGNNIHLSLRRVNSKEKKEVMQKFKQEQSIKTAFKQILEDEAEGIIEKITTDFENLSKFLEKSKEDNKILEKYLPGGKIDQIKKLTEKRIKNSELKKKIQIKCFDEDGVKNLKEIFNIENKAVSINYISAGNFTINLAVKDFKEGKKVMQELLRELEKKSKKYNCEFLSIEKK
jgi:translation initiation factor 2 alpha subunit (eIF-2alpha)